MKQIIRWNSSFNVGIQVIDEQHQQMISIINALFLDLETKIGEIDVKEFFKEAADYSEYHFQTEETFFMHYDYSERDEHLAIHHSYKRALQDMLTKEGGSHEKAEQLLDFLEKWWVNHINGIDQTLGSLVSQK